MLSISIVCDEFQAAYFRSCLPGYQAGYSLISITDRFIPNTSFNAGKIPDVVFLSVSEDEGTTLLDINIITNTFPSAEIILVLKISPLKNAHHFLAAGAIGIIAWPLTRDKIEVVINILEAGGSPIDPKLLHSCFDTETFVSHDTSFHALTTREQEVVTAISDGLSYKLVADRLNISLETVRHHVKNIYRKMKINSKGELLNKVFTEAARQ